MFVEGVSHSRGCGHRVMGKKKEKKMTLSTPMVLPKKFWKKKQEGEKRPTFWPAFSQGLCLLSWLRDINTQILFTDK